MRRLLQPPHHTGIQGLFVNRTGLNSSGTSIPYMAFTLEMKTGQSLAVFVVSVRKRGQTLQIRTSMYRPKRARLVPSGPLTQTVRPSPWT